MPICVTGEGDSRLSVSRQSIECRGHHFAILAIMYDRFQRLFQNTVAVLIIINAHLIHRASIPLVLHNLSSEIIKSEFFTILFFNSTLPV